MRTPKLGEIGRESRQSVEIFSAVKIEKFVRKILIFLIYLLKTLIVGTGYNRYPQSMFWIENKKNKYTP